MRSIKETFLFLKKECWLYTLLAFGFLFRLFYIFIFTKPESYLWSDAGYYDLRALEMAGNQYLSNSTFWPPFFHIFLSFIYRPLVWLGIESWRIKIDIIIFAFFYIVGFWCIYQIAKKLFSQKIALIVLVILIFWYPLIFLNSVVMSENLFFPLLFLGLYLLIAKPLKPSTGLWLGLLWGIAFITRPIFAFVLPFFVLWCLFYKINWKIPVIFILTAGAVIASMVLFNFYYTNGAEKSISSSGGFNFAALWCDAKTIGYTKNDRTFYFGSISNINYPDDKKILTTVPFENQNYYYRMGLNCIKEQPVRLIANFSSIIKLFNSGLFPNTGDAVGWEFFRIVFRFLTGLLFIGSIASVVGILINRILIDKENKKYFFLFALIVLSLLAIAYLQIVGEERYIIPYIPLLIILSAPIVLFLLERGYLTDNIIFLSILVIISFYIRKNLFDYQSGDYARFLAPWYDFIKEEGFSAFKNYFSNYTPLYLYILGFFTFLPISKLYAVKIISVVFDYLLAGFVFLIVRKKYKNNIFIQILSVIAILFAPTIILNGAYWGQNDVIYTAFLVASVYFLLKNKPLESLILYGISFSIKLQAIFLFPLFIILLLKKKIKLWHFLTIPFIYFITIIPGLMAGRPLKELLLIYLDQAGENYNRLSLNAPSLYQWLPSGQSDLFHNAGLLFALALIIIFIYAIYKNKKEIGDNQIIKIAFLSVILLPFLLPKMHERYFFPADVFSIIFAFYFPKYFFLPIAMQVISFLSYGPFLWGKNPNFPLLSLMIMVIILVVIYDLFQELSKEKKTEELP